MNCFVFPDSVAFLITTEYLDPIAVVVLSNLKISIYQKKYQFKNKKLTHQTLQWDHQFDKHDQSHYYFYSIQQSNS